MLHTIFWLRLLGVMGVNLMLSGDNAVLVAMAARKLPDRQRRLAITWGIGAIVVLLIAFTFAITFLLRIPLLRAFGALLLVGIAWKLATDTGQDEGGDVKAATSLWHAVRLIIVADMIMSLDNVIGLVAVSGGNYLDLAIGVAITMPVVIFGAALLTRALERWPWLVFLGAGLLVYLASQMVFQDRLLRNYIDPPTATKDLIGVGAGLVFIGLAWGWTHRRRPPHMAGAGERRTPAQEGSS